MKKILLIGVLIISILHSDAQFSKASLVASGLTCSMCSKSIYKALTKLSFVESVKANIKESSYSIIFKNNVPVKLDNIHKAVADAGFSVAKLQVFTDFSNVSVRNDSHLKVGNENLHFLTTNPQTLNGEVKLTVVDKGFVTDKEYKKYAASTQMKCYATGYMETCCNKNSTTAQRIYHVSL